MKNILLFGAGKSATVLIEYFLENAKTENWMLTLVDANLQQANQKIGNSPYGKALSIDITNDALRSKQIQEADIVVSLMPPALHILIAKDCIQHKKNLLTASYVDDQMRLLEKDIEDNGLLFLCEMGLDPGIDHMSAKKIIDTIHAEGGKITSFLSHCGGLVAPESDTNPWHYKISWNPRNVVMAGKAGAVYKLNGKTVELKYAELFEQKRYVSVLGHEVLCWYPNRDSLSYINTYGLQDISTFIRTTLRHPDFMYGWKNIIDLKLTSEQDFYETDQLSLAGFFKTHIDQNGGDEWLNQKLQEPCNSKQADMKQLAEKDSKQPEDVMVMDDTNLLVKQLHFLGMNDTETVINKGTCSAADVLQFALEKKLFLEKGDKDMIIMLHEIEFSKQDKNYKTTSALILNGKDDAHTAMAKTVGLPLGVAAKLILNETIKTTGLKIPVTKDIYEPVLEDLKKYGIIFSEETTIHSSNG